MDWLYDLIRLVYLADAAHEQYTTRDDPLPTLSRETSRVLADHGRLIAIAIIWATLVLVGAVCLVFVAAKINGQLGILGFLGLALVVFLAQGVLDAFSIVTVMPTLQGKRKATIRQCVVRVVARAGALCLWPVVRLFRNSMVSRLGVVSLLDGAVSFAAAERRAQSIVETGVSRPGSLILFGPMAALLLIPGVILALAAMAFIPDDWPVGRLPFNPFLLWGGAGLAWPLMCVAGLTFATRAIETTAAYVYVVEGRKPMYYSMHAMSGMVPSRPSEPLCTSDCAACGYRMIDGQAVCPECGSKRSVQQGPPG